MNVLSCKAIEFQSPSFFPSALKLKVTSQEIENSKTEKQLSELFNTNYLLHSVHYGTITIFQKSTNRSDEKLEISTMKNCI